MNSVKVGDVVTRRTTVGGPGNEGCGMFQGEHYIVVEVYKEAGLIKLHGAVGTWDMENFDMFTPLNPTQDRHLPDDTEQRKQFPLFDGLFGYFPNALCEVARWSVAGNNQHNPGQPLHWDMSKSTDHKNKIFRHTLDAEQINSEGFYEAIGAAWRALALAEEILLKEGRKPGAQVKNNPYGAE